MWLGEWFKLLAVKEASIVIPIDFTQFYTTLIEHGIVTPKSEVFYLYVPPNYTISWNVSIPSDYVSLIVEDVITVSPDHALSITIYADGELLFSDGDMVQDRYRESLNFPKRIGAIKPVKKSISFTLKNKTTNTMAYFSAWTSYGLIKRDYYERIYKKFFESLAITLGLPPYR